jgi:hypothetical protein
MACNAWVGWGRSCATATTDPSAAPWPARSGPVPSWSGSARMWPRLPAPSAVRNGLDLLRGCPERPVGVGATSRLAAWEDPC